MPNEKAELLPYGRIEDRTIAKKDAVHVADTCQCRDKAEPRVKLQSAMEQPNRLGNPSRVAR